MQRGALPDPGIHSRCCHALGSRGTEYTGTDPVCSPLKEEGIAQGLQLEQTKRTSTALLQQGLGDWGAASSSTISIDGLTTEFP